MRAVSQQHSERMYHNSIHRPMLFILGKVLSSYGPDVISPLLALLCYGNSLALQPSGFELRSSFFHLALA